MTDSALSFSVSLACVLGLSRTLSLSLALGHTRSLSRAVGHTRSLSRTFGLSLRSLLFCQVRRLILSGWPGEGRYPNHINWLLGFPRDRFLDPSSSPHTLHHWVPSYRHMASPTIATLMTNSSISFFQPDDPMVAARISGCLADISAWMEEHHLQLNLAKLYLANTELLVFPATPTLQHDFTIQLGSSIITPSASVRNLGQVCTF